MKNIKQKIAKILQYIATVFLAILTIGAFATSVLSGFIMLLSTLIAWPFTRNMGVNLVKKYSGGKIQVEQIKGWMFGASAFVLMIIALMVSPSNDADSDSQVAMVERGVQLETEDNRELDEMKQEQVVAKQDQNNFVESQDISDLDSEQEKKDILVNESDSLKEDSNQEDALTMDVKVASVPEQEAESDLEQQSTPAPESVTEPTSEPEPIPEPDQTPEPTPEPEPAPEPNPTSEPEPEEPIVKTTTEPTGSYAVNGKNGKIHMVGACPATGTGENAMTMPVYFNTYEEADAYSISIKASLEKRRCGNCW